MLIFLLCSGDPDHGIQEGEAQLMMGRMLHVLQDLTQFVSRITDLVRHTVQQLASLYSTEGYVLALHCLITQIITIEIIMYASVTYMCK